MGGLVGSLNYGRTCSVEFVPVTGLGFRVNPIPNVAAGIPLFPAQRVTFTVDKSISSSPQKTVIQIYNLAKRSRAKIPDMYGDPVQVKPFAFVDQRLGVPGATGAQSVARQNARGYLKLKAGYGGRNAVLFEGAVTFAESKRIRGTTWITTIEGGDGSIGIHEGEANKTFGAGTPMLEVVRYLRQTMALSPGTLEPFYPASILSGFVQRVAVMSGRASTLLDQIARGFGFGWFVEDGELWLIDGDGFVVAPPVVITEGADLLSTPRRLSTNDVECIAQLNPRIRPGRSVTLISRKLAGTYRLERVLHTGDNRAGRWISRCELRNLSPVPLF